MISIVNINENADPYGVNSYELRINNEVITTFEHKRSEGLAKCLLAASVASEKAQKQEFYNQLRILTDEMKERGK